MPNLRIGILWRPLALEPRELAEKIWHLRLVRAGLSERPCLLRFLISGNHRVCLYGADYEGLARKLVFCVNKCVNTGILLQMIQGVGFGVLVATELCSVQPFQNSFGS